MGGWLYFNGNSEVWKYLSIVFKTNDGFVYFNSTLKTIDGIQMLVPDTTLCGNTLNCTMNVGYCDVLSEHTK